MKDFGLQIDPSHQDGIEIKVTDRVQDGEEHVVASRVISKAGIIRWVFKEVRPE